MTTEEQAQQDLLVLIQGRNQRIAELELQVLNLSRNQCKGECNANGKAVQGEEDQSKKEKK